VRVAPTVRLAPRVPTLNGSWSADVVGGTRPGPSSAHKLEGPLLLLEPSAAGQLPFPTSTSGPVVPDLK